MAHRTRQRPNLAAWSNNSAVLNTEYDTFDAAQAASIDGDAGGAWSPAAKIVIGGAGLDMLGPQRALGPSDFSAAMQAQNWPERGSSTGTLTVNADVPLAWSPTMGAGGAAGVPVYCAIGDDGFPRTSIDGISWLSSLSLATMHGLAYGLISGSPAFLATRESTASFHKSADGGVTWAAGGATIPNHGVPVFAADIPLWAIAGDAGAIYTSPDGVTFTSRTAPAGWVSGCGGVKRLVRAAGLFVALPLGTYNKVLTSPDGITWTERTLTTTDTWTGLAYSSYDGMWIAVSANGQVQKSPNGTAWASVATTTLLTANDLAVNNSLWVAPTGIGALGGIAWSVDQGLTWRNASVGNMRLATNPTLVCGGWARILCVDNRFVVARATGTALEFALSLRSS